MGPKGDTRGAEGSVEVQERDDGYWGWVLALGMKKKESILEYLVLWRYSLHGLQEDTKNRLVCT